MNYLTNKLSTINYQSHLQTAKELALKAKDYAKENPDTVFLGLTSLLLLDISDSLDNLEDHSTIQTYFDLKNNGY